MRWLALFLVLIFLLLPISVSADANVTVIAVPYTGWAINNFTAVYVSDTQVDISWTPDFGVLNTMVRGKYGSIPTDITDGYLVYYGNGNNVSDTSMNFDLIFDNLSNTDDYAGIYYRAFAETTPGVFDDSTPPAGVEVIMILIALILLSLGLTVGGQGYKNVILVEAGALFWAIFGAYSYYQSTISVGGMSAIYYALFWGGMAMAVVCALSGAWVGRKTDLTVEEMVTQPTADEEDFGKDFEAEGNKLNVMRNMRDKRRGDI